MTKVKQTLSQSQEYAQKLSTNSIDSIKEQAEHQGKTLLRDLSVGDSYHFSPTGSTFKILEKNENYVEVECLDNNRTALHSCSWYVFKGLNFSEK